MGDVRPRIPKSTYQDMQIGTIEFERELGFRVTTLDLITAIWVVAGNHREEIKTELRRQYADRQV